MNKKIEVEITDIAYGGSGIGRVDGLVYFIPNTIPGEYVAAEVVKLKKKYALALLVEVLQSSTRRITPVCPLAVPGSCPGCSYQHIKYEEELRIKKQQLKNFLERGLKTDLSSMLKESFAAPLPLYYRNKIVLHAGLNKKQLRLGYKAKDNSTVIDIESCPLANTAINGLLAEFRKKHIKLLKNNDRVTFRQTANDGTLFWINSFGKKEPWLKEKTVCGDFYVPQGSFFQVNPQATDVLILKVIELLKQISPAYVIDLYCGCGLFSIVAAKAIQCRATGVDSDTKAIKAAKYNAQVHGVDKQCGFLANSAENMLKEIKNKIPVKESVLIVDPPRTGLSKGIRKEIAATQFGWIIYVSCSPDTMTRDLTALCETGYELKSAEVVDMFARTSHFESIVCLNHISKIRA